MTKNIFMTQGTSTGKKNADEAIKKQTSLLASH